MKISLDRGTLEITNDVLTEIITGIVGGCFGVKGMAEKSQGGIVRLIKRESAPRGVTVTEKPDGTISAGLHVVIRHGVNISAVCRSMIEAIRYNVEAQTGVHVSSVDICVDSVI